MICLFLLLIIFLQLHCSLATGKIYKRMVLPGSDWPNWVYKSFPSAFNNSVDCASRCNIENSTCNLAFYDETDNLCWLGTIGGNFGFQSSLGSSRDVWALVDYDYIQTTFNNEVIQITSNPNEQYPAYISTRVSINNTDGFWDCIIWCTKAEGGYCHYFTWINKVCSIGDLDNLPNAVVDGPAVPVYIHQTEMIRRAVSYVNAPGATWSKGIFQILNGIDTSDKCLSHCFIRFNPRCKYIVFISGNCYLGHPFFSQSVLGSRTDAQTIRFLKGFSFWDAPASSNDYLRFINSQAPAANADACTGLCLFNISCHFSIYIGTTCLMGNFQKPVISVGLTGTYIASIYTDNVQVNNIPDYNYVNSTVSNAVWTTKIFDNRRGVLSEGLCSAMCSLYTGLYACELHVWTGSMCYFGALSYVGNMTYPTGNQVMRTKKLIQRNLTISNGTWSATCPPGLSVMSCGIINNQLINYDPYRGLYPSDSATCTCFDRDGAVCVARCTTLPSTNFVMIQGQGSLFNVNCPPGYVAVGCHTYAYPSHSEDYFRYTYPLQSGSGCYCKDDGGIDCWASCAANITNYEIQMVYSSGNITVNCTNPKNYVLGCTFVPVHSVWEAPKFISSSGGFDTHICKCYSTQMGTCYAICGTL